MTYLYSIDRSRINGYLRTFDPIEQKYCLLPYNDTSRPIIVPQEYLIHFNDFLLRCNVPTIVAKHLTQPPLVIPSPRSSSVLDLSTTPIHSAHCLFFFLQNGNEL